MLSPCCVSNITKKKETEMSKKLIFRFIPVLFGFILGACIAVKSPAVFNKISGFLGSDNTQVAPCDCGDECECDCGCGSPV